MVAAPIITEDFDRTLFGGGWDPDPNTRRLIILLVAIVVGFFVAGIGF